MMEPNKKLTKSSDRFLTGVLGGVADYLEVDPSIVRLAFIAIMILTGVIPCTILYLIMCVIMPSQETR